MQSNRKGFTLLEVLVVVLIIGVLAAVALPQYQKAVLKSRYSALMPIAKSLANGNEAYYLEHGAYATSPTGLDVAGKDNYEDGTDVTLGADPEYLSYVRVANSDKVPDARYVVYQKHSANFADTTMCEAKGDTAKELCQRLGGVFVSDNGTEARWASYLLSGQLGAGSAFKEPCPENAVCNENDEIIFCSGGSTLDGGACVVCDIENATNCSGSSYRATSCGEGLCVQADGTCGNCDLTDDMSCPTDMCYEKTFGGNASCRKLSYYSTGCFGSVFSGESQCQSGGNCSSDPYHATTIFTDHASCESGAECHGAVFSGESTCRGRCARNYPSVYGPTTFTDNATCTDQCYGAVFAGNSSCTSTAGGGGCSHSGEHKISTFKDNAVCGGTGCDSANYEGNACCSSCSVGSGKPKCGGGTW